MTKRQANWLLLAGFILAGLAYLYLSRDLIGVSAGRSFGPAQFPLFLGGLLVVLCATEWVLSARRGAIDDEAPLEIPNAGKLSLTVVLTALYFFAWSATGKFYIVTAVFFFVMVMSYKQDRTIRSIITAAATSVLFSIALYLIFGVAFSVQLG